MTGAAAAEAPTADGLEPGVAAPVLDPLGDAAAQVAYAVGGDILQRLAGDRRVDSRAVAQVEGHPVVARQLEAPGKRPPLGPLRRQLPLCLERQPLASIAAV